MPSSDDGTASICAVIAFARYVVSSTRSTSPSPAIANMVSSGAVRFAVSMSMQMGYQTCEPQTSPQSQLGIMDEIWPLQRGDTPLSSSLLSALEAVVSSSAVTVGP